MGQNVVVDDQVGCQFLCDQVVGGIFFEEVCFGWYVDGMCYFCDIFCWFDVEGWYICCYVVFEQIVVVICDFDYL